MGAARGTRQHRSLRRQLRHSSVDVELVVAELDQISQYLTLHLTQRGASWASGAAQAAQVVRIILRWLAFVRLARRLE